MCGYYVSPLGLVPAGTFHLFSRKTHATWFIECWVSGFRFRISGFGVKGFGLRVSDFRFRVSGFGFRVQASGLRVQGWC